MLLQHITSMSNVMCFFNFRNRATQAVKLVFPLSGRFVTTVDDDDDEINEQPRCMLIKK